MKIFRKVADLTAFYFRYIFIVEAIIDMCVCDDLFVGGKVVLMSGLPIVDRFGRPVEYVRALEVEFSEDRLVYVQIWKDEGDLIYTLEWQVEIERGRTAGRPVRNLDEEDYFNVTYEHRLGLFSADPIPVHYSIATEGVTCFSTDVFRPGDINSHPKLNHSIKFETPIFPYRYEVNLCEYADCVKIPTTEPPSSSTVTESRAPQVQTSRPTTPKVAPADSDDGELMNNDFLTGVLIWMIILSFFILCLVIILLFFKCRPKIRKEVEGEVDNPAAGDWYVVVEDPSQIPQLSQMAAASSTTSRFSENDTAQILY